jgi:hypothetical protein
LPNHANHGLAVLVMKRLDYNASLVLITWGEKRVAMKLAKNLVFV